MTLKVIRLLQDLSNAIRRIFMQLFAQFQLTRRIVQSVAIAELLVIIFGGHVP